MLTVEEFWALSIEDREKLTPEQFEFVLKAGVQEVIDRAEPTQRLKLQSLQARCDRIRETIKNPQVVAAKIFSLMLDEGLFELNAVFKGEHPSQHKELPQQTGKVISMVRNSAATSE